MLGMANIKKKLFIVIILVCVVNFLHQMLQSIASTRSPPLSMTRNVSTASAANLLNNINIFYNRYCARRDPQNTTYGYATVIRQMQWITKNSNTVIEKDGPLIFYDNRYLWHGLSSDGCKYHCKFSTNFSDYPKAVLAVFTKDPPPEALPKPANQTWALESGESPFYMPRISAHLRHHFKIFLTTSVESHVPWVYAVFMANEMPQFIIPPQEQIRMLSENNTRWLPEHHAQRRGKVVALISNLKANNKRMEYISELANYIDIDLFGKQRPGCPRGGDACLQKLTRQYKFYLAFENAHCTGYITEKFFRNALSYGMIPVVLGASREDYCAIAPPNSFIHVDDFSSPADLAEYLHWLDRNDTAYASYFAWKAYGKISFNRRNECRLCGLLHQNLNRLDAIPTKGFDYFANPHIQCKVLPEFEKEVNN